MKRPGKWGAASPTLATPLKTQATTRGILSSAWIRRSIPRRTVALASGLWLGALAACGLAASPLDWPEAGPTARPRAYWWWMGSAVDTNNLARELARYRDAGLGGVHIIPIYGAKGWESNYLAYLSPRWMEMLDFTVTEAGRLGLEVDMTTGTGWCFGGPRVTDAEANALVVSNCWLVAAGGKLEDNLDPDRTQALMAFGPDGQKVDLIGRISPAGSVDWTAPTGNWTVYAISQKPGPQKVKRAAPGGEGWMLNLAYPQAMTNYLRWMNEGFAGYQGAKPRAQYHDSYEYKMDWSPVLLAEFRKRRGYRLQDELEAFLSGQPVERAARVKCDYRETISDIMVESTLPQWAQWAHGLGFLTRNEAHGSPGNWLDLYAAADIPETEMFYKDRNKLISKFASSAAHVTGKPLVAAETGTWVAEHFTESLADMKYLVDDLFLAGVNHVFYHGTCYSPDEAPWPGWVFYASYQMNPRNSVWRDAPALNAYVTRCQSVLQAGGPDNDILLYWPIHDFWSDPTGTARNLTVHAREWFEEQPIGKLAEKLWHGGYPFDYVSDRQLARLRVKGGRIHSAGGSYRIVLVPRSDHMPLGTAQTLARLVKAGATVVFEGEPPSDVPGWQAREARRTKLSRTFQRLAVEDESGANRTAREGQGTWKVWKTGELAALTDVVRETLFDTPGLMCLRRKLPDGRYYFLVNRGDHAVEGWVPLAMPAQSVVLLDPVSGQTGLAACRPSRPHQTDVRLHLPPGASVILRAFDSATPEGRLDPSDLSHRSYPLWEVAGHPLALDGQWQVRFLSGGPQLPAPFSTGHLASWTELGDTNAAAFAGTALYTLKFDAPGSRPKGGPQGYWLDLGRVCQSARVRLNGRDCGTVFTPPFRVVVDRLKNTDNLLEVEVTNTSANRIRDLDRRGVVWQNFYDINFVNLNYQKFDASNWPLADSGLLGPVTLAPVRNVATSPDTK